MPVVHDLGQGLRGGKGVLVRPSLEKMWKRRCDLNLEGEIEGLKKIFGGRQAESVHGDQDLQ